MMIRCKTHSLRVTDELLFMLLWLATTGCRDTRGSTASRPQPATQENKPTR